MLVIDDDRETLAHVRAALRRHGYCALGAGDGTGALEILRSVVVDLILLDLVMPDMDGREFLARKRALPAMATVPVVLVAGLPDRDAALPECIEFIRKPFVTADLLCVVDRYTRRVTASGTSSSARSE